MSTIGRGMKAPFIAFDESGFLAHTHVKHRHDYGFIIDCLDLFLREDTWQEFLTAIPHVLQELFEQHNIQSDSVIVRDKTTRSVIVPKYINSNMLLTVESNQRNELPYLIPEFISNIESGVWTVISKEQFEIEVAEGNPIHQLKEITTDWTLTFNRSNHFNSQPLE